MMIITTVSVAMSELLRSFVPAQLDPQAMRTTKGATSCQRKNTCAV